MRKVDYLRISVTDRCNERCTYCMPEGFSDWEPREEILDYEELLRVAKVAADFGFRKFRITGGEPLLRKDVVDFIERLSVVPGVDYLGLSTNATLLAPFARRLAAARVRSVNVSLDTLDADGYAKLTGGRLDKCLEGIGAAAATKTMKLKFNTVLIRGINEDQLLALARFAAAYGAPVRYIEMMPITTVQVLTPESFYSAFEARERLADHMDLEPVQDASAPRGYGPAVYYRATWKKESWDAATAAVRNALPGDAPDDTSRTSVLGLISPMTDKHFCDDCNKVRITPEGMLRPCLGNHLEFDLRSVLRSGGSDADLTGVFVKALGEKPDKHDFLTYDPARRMHAIGG